jgi:hypothetical protein
LPTPEARARPVRPTHASEHREPALLRLVEALIERRGRIREAFERIGPRAHCIRTLAQPLDRIPHRRRGTAGGEAVEARACRVADRTLDCWPVLLLRGRQSKPGLEAGNPGVGEGVDILRARLSALERLRLGRRWRLLLCNGDRCARDGQGDDCDDSQAAHGRSPGLVACLKYISAHATRQLTILS